MKITIHAKPGARIEEIKQIDETTFVVSVHEPPEGGKANEAIIGVLAKHFNTPKSRFNIVRGATTRIKWVEF